MVLQHPVRPLAIQIIAQLAPRLGLQVHVEPAYGYVGQVVTPDGRKLYFRNAAFDLNGQGAAELARDKAYAAYFMRRMGYPVAEGEAFFSTAWCRTIGSDRDVHAAYRYARALGFPVIVKPNSKSHGSGVVRVHNRRELYRALRAVFRLSEDRVALVQRVAPGDDYRIVVLDGEVVVAYRRLPLSVEGDGRATIAELLVRKGEQLARVARDTTLRADDYRIRMRLDRLRLSLQSVPARGERIVLLENANLATGGEAVDVSQVLHPGFQALARKLAGDMGLRYCGVDLITPCSIDQSPSNYVILEVNAAPGLDHYAACGPRQRQVVEAMYERILRGLAGL